ncbi:hypothetical protein Tco_1415299, partial [Tanacetum coccineum]
MEKSPLDFADEDVQTEEDLTMGPPVNKRRRKRDRGKTVSSAPSKAPRTEQDTAADTQSVSEPEPLSFALPRPTPEPDCLAGEFLSPKLRKSLLILRALLGVSPKSSLDCRPFLLSWRAFSMMIGKMSSYVPDSGDHRSRVGHCTQFFCCFLGIKYLLLALSEFIENPTQGSKAPLTLSWERIPRLDSGVRASDPDCDVSCYYGSVVSVVATLWRHALILSFYCGFVLGGDMPVMRFHCPFVDLSGCQDGSGNVLTKTSLIIHLRDRHCCFGPSPPASGGSSHLSDQDPGSLATTATTGRWLSPSLPPPTAT